MVPNLKLTASENGVLIHDLMVIQCITCMVCGIATVPVLIAEIHRELVYKSLQERIRTSASSYALLIS